MNLNIFKIRVNQKNQQLKRLEHKNKRYIEELTKLQLESKRKEIDELLNDKHITENPNIAHYQKKLKEKEQHCKNLTNRLRTYTLQEKRILVKERGFEIEREENFKVNVMLENQIKEMKLEESIRKARKYNY